VRVHTQELFVLIRTTNIKCSMACVVVVVVVGGYVYCAVCHVCVLCCVCVCVCVCE
jgi:hypothetical protein